MDSAKRAQRARQPPRELLRIRDRNQHDDRRGEAEGCAELDPGDVGQRMHQGGARGEQQEPGHTEHALDEHDREAAGRAGLAKCVPRGDRPHDVAADPARHAGAVKEADEVDAEEPLDRRRLRSAEGIQQQRASAAHRA